MKRFLIAACLLLPVALVARANSAPPLTYWIHEDAPGAVRICASGEDCSGRVLLRRDVATGAVVSMTSCGSGATAGCYLDECVPAGTYQYGLQVPYACDERWGAFYYAQEDVVGAPAGCTRTLPAPVAAASVPWGASDVICTSNYHGPETTVGCSSTGAVVGLNLLAIGAGLALRRRRRAG
ncbi:MAG: hypothetical protein QM704_10505 [Anaeromyxobacteraceae bacterium]